MKRYNSLNTLLKERFGCKVFKVTLASGLSCPNRDGTIGKNGCVFCSQDAYLTATNMRGTKPASISATLLEGIDYIKKRHGAVKFISYFQGGTNTNASPSLLSKMFDEAISHPDVVGLAIATRPDFISSEHVEMLKELAGRTMLLLELGLQSADDNVLKMLSRGHTVKDFSDAVKKLKGAGIEVVAHVIVGAPYESKRQILNTARFLNDEGVNGVKIHNLHVLKGTELEVWYNEGRLKICDLDTYAGLVVDFIERLDPSIVIHRVNAHAPRALTVAPEWSINKLAIFNAVEKEFERRDTWQGRKANG